MMDMTQFLLCIYVWGVSVATGIAICILSNEDHAKRRDDWIPFCIFSVVFIGIWSWAAVGYAIYLVVINTEEKSEVKGG